MSWTDTETRILIDLWNLGCSASSIVRSLPGKTRYAILGKIFRLRRHQFMAVMIARPKNSNKSHHTPRKRARIKI